MDVPRLSGDKRRCYLLKLLAGSGVGLAASDDIQDTVAELFTSLGTLSIVTLYILETLLLLELDDVRFPRGADMVIGGEGKGSINGYW